MREDNHQRLDRFISKTRIAQGQREMYADEMDHVYFRLYEEGFGMSLAELSKRNEWYGDALDEAIDYINERSWEATWLLFALLFDTDGSCSPPCAICHRG